MPKEITIPGLPPIKIEQALSALLTVLTLLFTGLGAAGLIGSSDDSTTPIVKPTPGTHVDGMSDEEIQKALTKMVEDDRTGHGIVSNQFTQAEHAAQAVADAASGNDNFNGVDKDAYAAIALKKEKNPTLEDILKELKKQGVYTNDSLDYFGVGVAQNDKYVYAVINFMTI